MFTLEDNVISTIKKHNMLLGGEKIIIAVSGGADSICLLSVMNNIADKFNFKIVAVHVNHNIRGNEAKRDEEFVEHFCNKRNIECIIESVDVPSIAKKDKISLELAGRNVRYNIFNKILREKNADKILVAHNKNDSVETVIMKLIRGTSLNGLKGISPTNGNIIRPLIECSRDDIEKYLKSCNIDFVTDSTNNEDLYTRNVIRHKIIPQFMELNPNVINTIYANCETIAYDDEYIDKASHSELLKRITVNKDYLKLDITDFDMLHYSIKSRVLLKAISCVSGSKLNIEQKHINILLNADTTGKTFDLTNGITVEKSYNNFIIKNNNQEYQDYCYPINNLDTVYVKDTCINFEITDNNDISDKSYIYINYDNLKGKSLYIRNRRDGDKFIPSGMDNEKKLSRFFIDNKIPNDIRKTIPLLCTADDIIAVLGMRVNQKYVVKKDTKEVFKIHLREGKDE